MKILKVPNQLSKIDILKNLVVARNSMCPVCGNSNVKHSIHTWFGLDDKCGTTVVRWWDQQQYKKWRNPIRKFFHLELYQDHLYYTFECNDCHTMWESDHYSFFKEDMNSCDTHTEEEIIKKYICATDKIRLQYTDSSFCEDCEFLNIDKYYYRKCSIFNTRIKDDEHIICGFKRCLDGSNPYMQLESKEDTPGFFRKIFS